MQKNILIRANLLIIIMVLYCQAVMATPPLLKDLAEAKGIDIGTLHDQGLTGETQDYYNALGNFNAITMNGFNWQGLAPTYCSIDSVIPFVPADAVTCSSNSSPTTGGEVNITTTAPSVVYPHIDFSYAASLTDKIKAAHTAGQKVHASHLTWGAKNPKTTWLWENYDINGGPKTPIDFRRMNKTQYEQIMENFVKTIVTYYAKSTSNNETEGAYVDVWSIANEFFSEKIWYPYGGGNYWLDKLNPMPNNASSSGRLDLDNIKDSYLAKILQWTRDADSNAVLMLNDYDNESLHLDSKKSLEIIAAMFKTVAALKRAEVPLDAIGMQMHLDIDDYDFSNLGTENKISKRDVVKVIEYFGALGVDVYITEIDVKLSDATGNTQTLDEKLLDQAQVYRDMLEACLATKFCKNYTTWGVGDEQSYDPHGRLLLFDKNFVPKPAYHAIYNILLDFDSDGIADDQDPDDDNDGVCDNGTAVPNVCASGPGPDMFPYNAAVSLDGDGDGIPGNWNTNCDTTCQALSGLDLDSDVRLDMDNDGISDHLDNCPLVSNSDQANADKGYEGDACDTDIDGDGLLNEVDPDSENNTGYIFQNTTADGGNVKLSISTQSNLAVLENAGIEWKLIHQIDACGQNIFNISNSSTNKLLLGTSGIVGSGASVSTYATDSVGNGTWTRVQWKLLQLGDDLFRIENIKNPLLYLAKKAGSSDIQVISGANIQSCGTSESCADWKFYRSNDRYISDYEPILAYDDIYQLDNDEDGIGNDCDEDDDNDNDGVLGTADAFPLNASASSDTDGDNRPDDCVNGLCTGGLIIDVFPSNKAASIDTDADGKPDDWNNDCDADCQSTSELTLDSDDDNDGVLDTADAFPLNKAASIDTDADGKPNDWNTGCDSTCQTESGLILDNDDNNDGVPDDPDNFSIITHAGHFITACSDTTCSDPANLSLLENPSSHKEWKAVLIDTANGNDYYSLRNVETINYGSGGVISEIGLTGFNPCTNCGIVTRPLDGYHRSQWLIDTICTGQVRFINRKGLELTTNVYTYLADNGSGGVKQAYYGTTPATDCSDTTIIWNY